MVQPGLIDDLVPQWAGDQQTVEEDDDRAVSLGVLVIRRVRRQLDLGHVTISPLTKGTGGWGPVDQADGRSSDKDCERDQAGKPDEEQRPLRVVGGDEGGTDDVK
jgi:hypothetical protein